MTLIIGLAFYVLFGIGVTMAAKASDEQSERVPSPGFYTFTLLLWPSMFMLAVMLALESVHAGKPDDR